MVNLLSAAALACLIQNGYHEARGESLLGIVAVTEVVLNRVDDNRWPDTVCEVVWQKNQFSWTTDGISDDMDDIIAYRNPNTCLLYTSPSPRDS